MLKAKLSTGVTIADLKAKGAAVNHASGTLTEGVYIKMGDATFYASKCKTFEGTISDTTTVFEGTNAAGQDRLYLTNKVGGFKIGAAI
jgi:hypothetical protein